jgi:hypothetical protein
MHGPHLDEIRVRRARLRLSAAVQVAFERQTLKPGYHLMGSRVETTWVPGTFQLWVRGSQRAPPRLARLLRPVPKALHRRIADALDAASPVAFEKHKILKPGYHITGSRVETRRLSSSVQRHPTCTAPSLPCLFPSARRRPTPRCSAAGRI